MGQIPYPTEMVDTTRRFGPAVTGSEGIKGLCGCAYVPASTTSLLIWRNVYECSSSVLANAYHILEADDNARCADNVFQQPGTITPAIFSPTNNLRNETQLWLEHKLSRTFTCPRSVSNGIAGPRSLQTTIFGGAFLR
jgi:hypothetical protein